MQFTIKLSLRYWSSAFWSFSYSTNSFWYCCMGFGVLNLQKIKKFLKLEM